MYDFRHTATVLRSRAATWAMTWVAAPRWLSPAQAARVNSSAITLPCHVRKSLAVTAAGDLAQVVVDVRGVTLCTLPSASAYWNSSWPGSALQRRTTAATRRSDSVTSWRTPLLPLNDRLTSVSRTPAWRVRRVVRP